MSMGTWILILCCLPVIPLVYFVQRNEAKPKKNIVLGVTLPHGYAFRPEVQALCRGYRRELSLWTLLVAGVGLSALLFAWFSIQFLVVMLAVLLMCVLPFLSFVRYHRRLRALKRENGWFIPGAPVQVDTRAAAMAAAERRPSDLLFLPPILLRLIPMALELLPVSRSLPQEKAPALLALGFILLTTVLFPCLNRVLYRQRTEVLDRNSDLNLALTRIRRRQWSRVNLWLSYLTGLFSIVFWCVMRFTFGETLVLLAGVGYTLGVVGVAASGEFACRRAQERLSLLSNQPVYADQDQYWPLGMFYYNPGDPRLIIQNRTGLSTTMNLARPMGKLLVGVAAACLLSIPVLCGWLMAEEFTPLTVTVSNDRLLINHITQEVSLPLSDIGAAAPLSALPPCRKVFGSNLDTLFKGTFEVEGYGVCTLYLNPKAPPFVVLDTGQGRYLLPAGEWEEAVHAGTGS